MFITKPSLKSIRVSKLESSSFVLLECLPFGWDMVLLESFWTCGCGRDNRHLQQNLHLGDFSSAIWMPAFSRHVYLEGEFDFFFFRKTDKRM